ncbi:hypothetical protein DMA11_19475 [Marinilabiliaceae bacterium JC017]|nr:hypothetical protein DMA11_19475 [Marinilabiliaceae bacterium JC017]
MNMKQLFTISLLLLMTTGYSSAQKRTVKKSISLTGTTFRIRNVRSGKYLDVPGYGRDASTSNGRNVQLWDLDDGADRKFKFEPAGGGYYYIKPQHANVRLDVEGCWPGRPFCHYYKDEKGSPIQIWSFDTNKVGRWRLEQVNNGQFLIINKYSGMAIDAKTKPVYDNGCPVIQWKITYEDIQLWELIDTKTGQRYEE